MDVLHTPKNFLDDLMVVLVIYKMEINESLALNSLTAALRSMNQMTSIFIYDNSPTTHKYSPNENWITTYRSDPSNPGVSKAYNECFSHAKAQNKKWMLLADQDTVFEKDFFLKCKSAIEVYENENVFVPIMIDFKGTVSPFIFRFGRGVRLKKINAGQYQLEEKKFINSGILISCGLFEQSGGFDERYQLDFSDLAFIERLKSVTRTFLVIDSKCTHSLFAMGHGSLEETLERFKIYCQSSNRLGNQTGNFWVLIWKPIRAIKLSLRFRSIGFIKLLAQTK